MEKILKEIVKKYRFSKDIKRFSYSNKVFYRTITKADQIKDYQTRAYGAYELVKNNYPLHSDDIDYLKEAIAQYEICISKCISLNDNFIIYDEWRIEAKELEVFINELFKLYELYDQLKQRKLFQD